MKAPQDLRIDLVHYGRRLVGAAPEDAEAWLLLGWALESTVWGRESLELFPKWPWTGRHPQVLQHVAYNRGEEGAALVAPPLGFGDLQDVREIFDDVKFTADIEPLPDGAQRVSFGWEAMKNRGPRIPEYVLHEAWELRLRKGRIGDLVREDEELATLSASDLSALTSAAEAYARAASLPLDGDQALFLAEAILRLVASEALYVPWGISPIPLCHGLDEDFPRQSVGAADVLVQFDVNKTISSFLRVRTRFRFQIENDLPGFRYETISELYGRAGGDKARDMSKLVEAAEDLLAEEIASIAQDLPNGAVFQTFLTNGNLSPPLLVLDEGARSYLRARGSAVDEVGRLLLFLPQIDEENSLDWALIRERWMRAVDGKSNFYWGSSILEHLPDQEGGPARIETSMALTHALLGISSKQKSPALVAPEGLEALNARMDVVAPWI